MDDRCRQVDALRHKHNPTTAGTVYPVEHVLAREAAYGLSINQTLLLPYKSLGQEEPEHMGTKAALIVRNVWQQWCAGNQCGETVTKAMHHAISLLQDKVMVQRWVDKSTAAIGHLLGFFGVSYSLAKILMINWQIFYSAMLSLALSIMLG